MSITSWELYWILQLDEILDALKDITERTSVYYGKLTKTQGDER